MVEAGGRKQGRSNLAGKAINNLEAGTLA